MSTCQKQIIIYQKPHESECVERELNTKEKEDEFVRLTLKFFKTCDHAVNKKLCEKYRKTPGT